MYLVYTNNLPLPNGSNLALPLTYNPHFTAMRFILAICLTDSLTARSAFISSVSADVTVATVASTVESNAPYVPKGANCANSHSSHVLGCCKPCNSEGYIRLSCISVDAASASLP